MDNNSSVEVIIGSEKRDAALESLCDSGSHLIISPSGLSQRPSPQRSHPVQLTMSSSIQYNDTIEPTVEVLEYKVKQDISIENIKDEHETEISNTDESEIDLEVSTSASPSKKKGLIAGIRRSAKGVKTAAVDLRKRGKSKEGKTKKKQKKEKVLLPGNELL